MTKQATKRYVNMNYLINHISVGLFCFSSRASALSELRSCLYHVWLLVCVCDTFHLTFIMQHNRVEHDNMTRFPGGWMMSIADHNYHPL